MRVLGRVFLFLFGVLLAVSVGLFVFVLGLVIDPAAWDLMAELGAAAFESLWSDRPGTSEAGVVFIGFVALSPVLLLLPPTLIALVGEVAGIRSFVWYGFGTGGLTAALPWLYRGAEHWALAGGRITALLFVTGAGAGLIYWLVAGRTAGITAPGSSGS